MSVSYFSYHYFASVLFVCCLKRGITLSFFFNPLCVLILWFDREIFDCIQFWRHASDRFRWVLRAHAGRRTLLFDLFARRFLCVWSSVLCTMKSSQSGKKEARESDVFFSPPHWTCSNDYGYYDINICKHDVTCVLVFIVHRHNWWLLCPLFFSCKGYALLFIPCCSYSWCPADVCFVSFEILFEVSTVAVGLWWVENCKKKLNSWSHSWSKRLF